MVEVKKNTEDKTAELVEKFTDEIITDFNNGGRFPEQDTRMGFTEIFTNDYPGCPVGAMDLAMRKIAEAGYYVWKISAFIGRRCNYDTLYRITKVKVSPGESHVLAYHP